MSDLLIKGMTLPEEGETLILAIDSEGNIDQQSKYLNCFYHLENVAIEVPTHGRLIDVDKLLKEHPRISSKYPSETFYENLEIFNMLSDAPTVIEANT